LITSALSSLIQSSNIFLLAGLFAGSTIPVGKTLIKVLQLTVDKISDIAREVQNILQINFYTEDCCYVHFDYVGDSCIKAREPDVFFDRPGGTEVDKALKVIMYFNSDSENNETVYNSLKNYFKDGSEKDIVQVFESPLFYLYERSVRSAGGSLEQVLCQQFEGEFRKIESDKGILSDDGFRTIMITEIKDGIFKQLEWSEVQKNIKDAIIQKCHNIQPQKPQPPLNELKRVIENKEPKQEYKWSFDNIYNLSDMDQDGISQFREKGEGGKSFNLRYSQAGKLR
jgi:hypothetical protein